MKINFHDSDEKKLFVTGCLHLNHNPKWEIPLWKLRGYESSEQMTDGVIESINNTCRETDILLVLGDFSLNTTFDQFNELIWRIKPEIWMIEGNHNSPWQKEFEDMCMKEYGFKSCFPFENWLGKVNVLGPYMNLTWNKHKFVCNHYPFAIWDGLHKGVMSLHSHCHGKYTPSLPDSLNGGKQLDCGWDIHRRPLSFEDIIPIMNKKEIVFKDHHK